MKSDWQIRTHHDFIQNGIAIAILKGDAFCTGMTFEAFKPGGITKPIIEAGPDGEAFLRAALNAAWERGLRPDGFEDTRESMKATSAHLQDMRALAFHKIGAQKP